MTDTKIIPQTSLNQLTMKEKEGLIAYFRFKGVYIRNIIEDCFKRGDRPYFLIYKDRMHGLSHGTYVKAEIMSLEELKLLAGYFHDL